MTLQRRWLQFRLDLARRILPPGWNVCLIGKVQQPPGGYFDVYGDWHEPDDASGGHQ